MSLILRTSVWTRIWVFAQLKKNTFFYTYIHRKIKSTHLEQDWKVSTIKTVLNRTQSLIETSNAYNKFCTYKFNKNKGKRNKEGKKQNISYSSKIINWQLCLEKKTVKAFVCFKKFNCCFRGVSHINFRKECVIMTQIKWPPLPTVCVISRFLIVF